MTKDKDAFRSGPVNPRRAILIRQLRKALYLAESLERPTIEFDILETTFKLEFD